MCLRVSDLSFASPSIFRPSLRVARAPAILCVRGRVCYPKKKNLAQKIILLTCCAGQIESNYDETTDSFDNMNLKAELLRGVYAYGFERPSAIQQRAIMPVIKGECLPCSFRTSPTPLPHTNTQLHGQNQQKKYRR